MGVESEYARLSSELAILAGDSSNGFPRRLVFQRPPTPDEAQADGRGFPVSNWTDIDPKHPVPCTFTFQMGRKVVITGQERTVTLFRFTTPSINHDGPVDFDPEYRVHVLATDSLPEIFLQVVGGGDDIGAGITFVAVKLEELV